VNLIGPIRLLLASLVPQRRKPDARYAVPGADRDLRGKTVVFIGGTDGMGRVAVEMLFRMGASIVLLGRDESKTAGVISDLQSSGGDGALSFVQCDLLSLESVRASADNLLDETRRIDVLVNCAGANFQERVVTSDGFERNWSVNYLGPVLLARLLLERLRKSAPARIVNVSSATEALGHIDFDDLDFERGYSPGAAYARAKLALIMFTIDLASELEGTGVTVNALNPGFIKSNLLRDLRGFESIGKVMMNAFASPAEVGADRIVRLAISSDYEGVSGVYVYEDKILPPNPEALDDEIVARLMRSTRASLARPNRSPS